MPFDGTAFQIRSVSDTGIFPVCSKHGARLWINGWFRSVSRDKAGKVALRAPSSRDRYAAVVQLLRDAKELIQDQDSWNRRLYHSWRGRRCAVGALRAAAKSLADASLPWSAHTLLITVARARGFTSVEAMNDRSSHAEVLRAFDEAIALAGGIVLAGREAAE